MSIELSLRKFLVPEFIFGVGSVQLAGQYARNFGARKILVVTDAGVAEAGWTKQVLDSLAVFSIPYVVFDSVSQNPKDFEVHNGAAIYTKEKCNLIVAVGGGSPIDCAKGIGVIVANQGDIAEYEGVDSIDKPIPPLICIPTTGGSSADVSQFSIIADTRRKVKFAIVSKMVVPDVALIDPSVLFTLSDYLLVCTAIDALTHAVEAYVSTVNSQITDIHALEAIRLIHDNIFLAIKDSDLLTPRSNLMLASLHAGMAFSNAILGAVHAMAHSLGGYYDLNHGECNAILLPHVVEQNYQAAAERYDKIGLVLGVEYEKNDNATVRREKLVNKIRSLTHNLRIVSTLESLGVHKESIPKLAENALKDACMATNPRQFTQREVEDIYEAAY